MLHRRTSSSVRRPIAASVLAVAALALGGCQSAPDPAAKADDGPSVVAPGKPGEAAETLSAKEAKKALSDDSPNSADTEYVQGMIHHHRQALVMTDLAKKHATSRPVRSIAARIAAAQGPEIQAMEGWLKSNDVPKGHAGHSGPMPGMATEAQLEELKEARNRPFDTKFLKLMITHHQGAVTMASEVLSGGNNVTVEEMAGEVVAQQTSEINRMRKML
ncbi:MAG: DUF305 domain-containing protein [Streptomyces sp.]|uniref:DUF305 domain-containing protein n=1 Tax=Streptomyces sp. TaxID=1931 RepID=UPI003D6AA429